MPGRRSSRSRKRSGGGGWRDRSASTRSSRGPHSVPDTVFWKPWHQQPVFSRFWQHYAVLMQGAPITAMRHAAEADSCGACCCCSRRSSAAPTPPQAQTTGNSRKRQRENLCRKHKQQQKKRSKPQQQQQKQAPCHSQGLGVGAPSQGYRDPGAGFYDSDTGGYYHHPEQGYDHEYDEDDTGYYDPDTGYYYDIPYDQESASELTSQMNAGMHIDDQGQTTEPSEEFLAFIAESARHREEWKKRKAIMNQAGLLLSADMELDEDGKEKEPKEHPDSVRSREMKELYGAAAPRLHAMETAVQLAFERVATRRHTKLWPNIPINVIFGDV